MDVEAMNNILDCLLGPDQGAAFPATLRMEIWAGDPRLSGTAQVTYPSYAAQTISTSTSWTTPASGGVKQRDAVVAFPAPSGEADDVGTHWAMFNPATDALYFVGLLGDQLDISGVGPSPTVLPRVRAADALALIA